MTKLISTDYDFQGNIVRGLLAANANGQALEYEQFKALKDRPAETFVDVSIGFPDPSTFTFGSFSTIIFPAIASNANSLYDSATGHYSVPSTGLYQISGTIRSVDSSPAGVNFGVGVHTSNDDGPWFLWHSVQDTIQGHRRTTYPYLRVGIFPEGGLLRMFTYADQFLNGLSASMQILRIG